MYPQWVERWLHKSHPCETGFRISLQPWILQTTLTSKELSSYCVCLWLGLWSTHTYVHENALLISGSEYPSYQKNQCKWYSSHFHIPSWLCHGGVLQTLNVLMAYHWWSPSFSRVEVAFWEDALQVHNFSLSSGNHCLYLHFMAGSAYFSWTKY